MTISREQFHLAFFAATLIYIGLLAPGGMAAVGAEFPNTSTCRETPEIVFPTTVTIANDYLLVFKCPHVLDDWNAGDFVTAFISDRVGSAVESISQYVETDAGVEWVSPLSDNNGWAWSRLYIDPTKFDCNATGASYKITANWDGHQETQNFVVRCPIITLNNYRNEVPYWQDLVVKARVTDDRGYSMRGLPCTAQVVEYSGDLNKITIKETSTEQFTDYGGNVKYTFNTGLINDLLIGYQYAGVINCMGADANFLFEIEQSESVYTRNPLYFSIVFLSDNIVPIVMAVMIIGAAITIIYLLLRRD